jgi:hypothetical protein
VQHLFFISGGASIMKKRSAILLASLFSVFLLSCGGDDAGGNGATTDYEGVIAFENGESGTINITLPEEAYGKANVRAQGSGAVNITGECIFTGGSVNLEGSIDPSDGSFTLTGDGYTFDGTFNFEDGTFTGTLEFDGSQAGTFSGVDSTGEGAQLFCGTYETTDPSEGVFVVAISGTTVTGSYAGTNNDGGNLTGTLDGDSWEVDSTEGGSAYGTVDGNTVTGTIRNNFGEDNGSLSGSTSACP